MSTVVYNAEQIETALQAMSESIHTARDDAPWAIVGIRRGGEHLANRIAELLSERTGTTIPVGYVDITLYRDDGFGPNDWPAVGVTEIPFELKKYTVVLVDDVLYTGRTVRAAIDAIIDYGRPLAIRLATLVDRGLRELPIQADTVGFQLETAPNQEVNVTLVARGDNADLVTLGPRGNGDPKETS
ncbi:MAG: bifunctional pyr operon transcriptional regulator/uracil phosphoribosyltransferase PyrR [Myxococcota bacterium]|nr:bifunctional pyr operon transcriptional regulator/uracil phosphoribosyltransferase PyrR [Myxococcota bacterium]